MYLLDNNWANCLKTHNKLTMCLPGKTPSAPSDGQGMAQQVTSRRVTRRESDRVWDIGDAGKSCPKHGWGAGGPE